MTSRADEMDGALRALGLKITAQRRAIVLAFAADPTHPTAQEIYDRLREHFPGLSVATVYNTLATLRAAGLCREAAVASGAARFDPTTHHHDHTVCDGCGAVRDVETGGAVAASTSPRDFAVRAVELVYRGLCARCQAAPRVSDAKSPS